MARPYGSDKNFILSTMLVEPRYFSKCCFRVGGERKRRSCQPSHFFVIVSLMFRCHHHHHHARESESSLVIAILTTLTQKSIYLSSAVKSMRAWVVSKHLGPPTFLELLFVDYMTSGWALAVHLLTINLKLEVEILPWQNLKSVSYPSYSTITSTTIAFCR